ncbi:hypothetical protein [Kineococcus sp. SYSU DK002]|uniref:hypothetical protein n=1 Tax=Kineococcus sp. SYSU DK002 TaxID=3383123 RepID=UPI003D7D874D
MVPSQDALDAAQQRAAALRSLLHRVRDAAAVVPALHRPTGVVGAAGAWTGRVADRLHRDELVPAAGRLDRSLRRAVDAVEDALRDAEGSVRHLAERVASEERDEAGRLARAAP